MKEIILYDNGLKDDLFPFALTRHVADIRVGILTIREKWEKLSYQPILAEINSSNTCFPANLVPSKNFVLPTDRGALHDTETFRIIQHPWHIFQFNDWAIRNDFDLITSGKVSAAIPETVFTTNSKHVFVEEGASLAHCILNASTGPIYIGKNATVMEGVNIRGPFALCEGAVVKMGARIYGATTVGPYSVVGGEIKNSMIFGYSNKAHDGYLGDAVIGEWCNLGAGSSNSNLKNNASIVNVWNQPSQSFKEAGTKCGLLMGDFSMSAINTSFNTGTVIGICSNVFGVGLTPAFIPAFSWGYSPREKYQFEKSIRDITNWKKLKGKTVAEQEVAQLRNIFNQS